MAPHLPKLATLHSHYYYYFFFHGFKAFIIERQREREGREVEMYRLAMSM